MSRVAYFYDPDMGNFYYGPGHPMKPYRLAITHHLINRYGLLRHLDVYRPPRASRAELEQFHTPEFIDFLYTLRPRDPCGWGRAAPNPYSSLFKLTDDCPVFDGMSNFFEMFAGASIDAARKLNQGLCDWAISWSGGLHHARRQQASGFCYVNDIVLSIIELLKYHPRVLYVDIDIHHGDGVQDAFYLTDRVLTISFHKYGNGFFPGTGGLDEIGIGQGKYCSVNVPLKDGIDDASYHGLYKPIVTTAVETYRPSAIVLQCGADSLNLDRLGCFNLSHVGHGECVKLIKSFNIPTVFLGGGGYLVKNVARAWTYETSIICGADQLPREMPPNDYSGYFAPDHNLLPSRISRHYENQNSRAYLDLVRSTVLGNIRALGGAPVVQMPELPPQSLIDDIDWSDKQDPDTRSNTVRGCTPHQHPGEFYDDDADQDHGTAP
eukprot:m51a1_g7703 putative histone deacetylase 3 (436) ;mRNA; f:80375-82252